MSIARKAALLILQRWGRWVPYFVSMLLCGISLISIMLMTQAMTSLNMMTNRPGLTPATQPQQPLQLGSTSKQLFSRPGFNNTCSV